MPHARGALLDQARRLFVFPHLFSSRYGFTRTAFTSCCPASGAGRVQGECWAARSAQTLRWSCKTSGQTETQSVFSLILFLFWQQHLKYILELLRRILRGYTVMSSPPAELEVWLEQHVREVSVTLPSARAAGRAWHRIVAQDNWPAIVWLQQET